MIKWGTCDPPHPCVRECKQSVIPAMKILCKQTQLNGQGANCLTQRIVMYNNGLGVHSSCKLDLFRPQQGIWDPSELELQAIVGCPTQFLRTELRSSERVRKKNLNCWTIPPECTSLILHAKEHQITPSETYLNLPIIILIRHLTFSWTSKSLTWPSESSAFFINPSLPC